MANVAIGANILNGSVAPGGRFDSDPWNPSPPKILIIAAPPPDAEPDEVPPTVDPDGNPL